LDENRELRGIYIKYITFPSTVDRMGRRGDPDESNDMQLWSIRLPLSSQILPF
jgi:hypothetical protein